MRTVSLAPPESAEPASTEPPWALGDRAHDRQPEPRSAARRLVGGAAAAHEAPEDLVAQLARGSRGRRPRRSSSASSPSLATRTRTSVPGGVWIIALSIRLTTMRWSSSGLPVTGTGASPETLDDLVPAGDRLDLGHRRGGDLGQVAVDARAGAARVGAREQQQVGDEPAHAPRGAQRRGRGGRGPRRCGPNASSEAWSSSRLASVLVSGVRSSCEASATKSRWACIACSRSVRAASSARSIWSSVAASSPTSSSVTGRGHAAARGRGSTAISRAAPVSDGDRAHRAPRDDDARERREQRSRRARPRRGRATGGRSSPRGRSWLRAYWT